MIALWSRIKGWAAMAGAVIAVLFGAYAAGGRAARRSAEIDRARQREKSLKKVQNVDSEISKMGASDLRRHAERWMLDDTE